MTMLGRKHSPETKQMIREKLLGRRTRPVRKCLICGKDGVRKDRKYCSEKCYGLSRRGIATWMKGKKHKKVSREKIGKRQIGKTPWNYGKPNLNGRGENCHLWKGGITKENAKIRTSVEYKNWMRAVFKRDDWTCKECGKRGGDMEAHHKKSFATHKSLRFNVSNGATLCRECHKKTDSYLKNIHYAIV